MEISLDEELERFDAFRSLSNYLSRMNEDGESVRTNKDVLRRFSVFPVATAVEFLDGKLGEDIIETREKAAQILASQYSHSSVIPKRLATEIEGCVNNRLIYGMKRRVQEHEKCFGGLGDE